LWIYRQIGGRPKYSQYYLGAYRDKRLVYQGQVTLGLSREEFKIISKQKRRSASPFDDDKENAVYIDPILVCTVKYMERNKNGGLRQPVFRGLRYDKAAGECIV